MDKTELSKLTVVKLRELLKKKGLPVAGRKDELIERLLEDSNPKADAEEEDITVSKTTKEKKSKQSNKSNTKKISSDDEDEEEETPVKKTKGRKRSAPDNDELVNLTKQSPKIKKVSDDKRGSSKKVDPYFSRSNATVYEDEDFIYDCMLNQTNIANNNNKFYKIQLVQVGSIYHVLIRYGRVGEDGKAESKTFSSLELAKNEFKNKFKLKTKNEWKQGVRDNFVSHKGKYTLLSMKDDDEDDSGTQKINKSIATHSGSKLDKPIFDLIKFIFDHDMFKSQMAQFELDVDQLPLGKISKEQVEKGYEILKKIKKVIEGKAKGSISELSGLFYTHIPHKFGRKTPTPINTSELLKSKFDLCNVLADIEVAQSIMKVETTTEHPMDYRYRELDCTISLLDKNDIEYKYVQTYFQNTKSNYPNISIVDIFKMDRRTEKARFEKFDHINERKLLWHGTNVAVVVAILKTGLRIMPHSGGRVGRGIYFASLNQKSIQYVGRAGNVGFMFLAEVAIGKQHVITRDDPSLRKPPSGYDSVLAHGHIEPDQKYDVIHNFEGKDVIIPQGKPISTEVKSKSSFLHSEYLVYDEGQVRLRYLLKIKYN